MSSIAVINKFWGRERGGIEAVLHAEVTAVAQRGWSVRVLACRPPGSPSALAPPGAPGVAVRELTAPVVLSMPLRSGFRAALSGIAHGAGLLHFHLPFPLAEMAALRVPKTQPWVATVHAEVVGRPEWQTFWQSRITQRFLRHADIILVGSPAGARMPMLNSHRSRVRVLPFGFDLAPYTSIPPRTAHASRPGIVFLGRLVPYKGLDVLLHALVPLDARLEIIGGGRERIRLERLAQSLGLAPRVQFHGHVPDAALPPLFARADIFVLPSCTRAEAFGVAQVEAMAAGLPIVNTVLGTGTDWVSPSGITGLSVAPNEPAALHAALARLIADHDFRLACGIRARQRARSLFSIERHAEELEALYQSLITPALARRATA